MSEMSVFGGTPSSTEKQQPPDVRTVMRAASQALSRVTVVRYDDLLAMLEELQGHLHTMIDAVTEQAEKSTHDASRRLASARLAEADHRLGMTPGQGLQSAVDHVRATANVLIMLCEQYRVFDEHL